MQNSEGRRDVAQTEANDGRYQRDLEMLAAYSTELVRQTNRHALVDLVCTNTIALLNLDMLCLVMDDGIGGLCVFSSESAHAKPKCLPLALYTGFEQIGDKTAHELTTTETEALYRTIPELNLRFAAAANHTIAAARIETDDSNLGFMLTVRKLPRTYSPHDLRLLTQIAQQVAYALKRIKITEAQNRTARETQIMLHMSAELAAVSDMAMAAAIVAEQARLLMSAATSGLIVVNRTTNCVEFSAFNGVRNHKLDAAGIELPPDIDFDTFWQNTPIFHTSDYLNVTGFSRSPVIRAIIESEGVSALMAAPMTLGQHGYGVLVVAERRRKVWSEDEQTTFVRFSRYIGSQLDNVWLYEEQRRHYAELERKNAQLTAVEARQLQLEATLRTTRGVSHILSQPLTVILGYADLLQQGEALSNEEMKIFEAAVLRARNIMQKFNSMQDYSITEYDGQDSLVSFEDD